MNKKQLYKRAKAIQWIGVVNLVLFFIILVPIVEISLIESEWIDICISGIGSICFILTLIASILTMKTDWGRKINKEKILYGVLIIVMFIFMLVSSILQIVFGKKASDIIEDYQESPEDPHIEKNPLNNPSSV